MESKHAIHTPGPWETRQGPTGDERIRKELAASLRRTLTRPEALRESVRALGFFLDTYSPGDGVTRYRFFDRPSEYFGPWNGIYTALGISEAETFAAGLAQGSAKRATEGEATQ